MLLVDSTLYVDLLRARKDPVEVLRPWLIREEITCCGIIRCEVLRGMVNDTVRERRALDRRGTVLPVTDLVIACCAFRATATVVSSDRRFKRIPGLVFAPGLPKA